MTQPTITSGLQRRRRTTPEQDIRDFTLPVKPIRFRIDDDLFEAPGILSIITLRRIATLYREVAPKLTNLTRDDAEIAERLDAIAGLFRTLIPGASGERFAERLTSETEPIDLMRQAMPILHYLLERYGLRPTQPSSGSANGSTTLNGDMSSTDGASPEVSTRPS